MPAAYQITPTAAGFSDVPKVLFKLSLRQTASLLKLSGLARAQLFRPVPQAKNLGSSDPLSPS
jgi:hypothetical protein